MIVLVLLAQLLGAPPADLVALGAVLSPQPAKSHAVLRSGGKTMIVAPGEAAFGGRVLSVSREGISLEYGGGRVVLRLGAGLSGVPAPAPTPEAANDQDVMSRQAVEKRLTQEIPRILAETTLVPVTEHGQVAGYTLTRLPQGSLLTDAGLRPGDVILRINGTTIDSLATLAGLWPRLQAESRIEADILRNGEPMTLGLTLQ